MRDATLILRTKLVPPQPAAVYVPRDVEARLGDLARRPLTIVAAPTGFGKTSAVVAWARSDPASVAWVSLDTADNDPARLFAHVAAALTGATQDTVPCG